MVLVQHDGDVGMGLHRRQQQVAQVGLARVLRAPVEACRITGLRVSSAASMMAWICSRLLTLNAGTP